MSENECAADKYTGRQRLSLKELSEYASQRGVRTIRADYTDILGIERGKAIPVNALSQLERGITGCSSILALSYDNFIVDSDAVHDKLDDLEIEPDLSTLRLLPYLPGTAIVYGDISYRGARFPGSPRVFLKTVVDEYHALGLEPVCACELEFFAFRKTENGGLAPYADAECNCYTSTSRNDERGLISGITDALSDMGFPVTCCASEFYPGQFEINWAHSLAVDAADNAMLFKTVCREIAAQKGLMVSFMAKPAGAGGGSGCHAHLSLRDMKTGRNVFYDEDAPGGMSQNMLCALAGMLCHAPACTAYLAPTVNCYKRYQPDSLAPTYIAWGHDNRTAYARVPVERGEATRIEIRGGSAACNPYIALGVLLYAGLDGIRQGMTPPEPSEENLYRAGASRYKRLPRSLEGALHMLRHDKLMSGGLMSRLNSLFMPLKRYECDSFDRYVTDWETRTYFHHT